MLLLLIVMVMSGCATVTKTLAQTLRYSDGSAVGIKNIDFKGTANEESEAKPVRGTYFFFIPVYGDGSILSAADQEISTMSN